MIGQLEVSEPAQPITGSGRSKSRYQTQTQNIVGSIQQNCSIWTQAAVAVSHYYCYWERKQQSLAEFSKFNLCFLANLYASPRTVVKPASPSHAHVGY